MSDANENKASLWGAAKNWMAGPRTAVLPPVEELSPDAIVMIDATGMIRSFNPAAERLFGYGRSEVTGHNVKMLMPSHFRSEHDAYIGRYVSTNQPHIVGFTRVVAGEKKDGSTIPLEISVVESRIGSEPVFVAFIRDLTEVQAQQRRMQELQRELFHTGRLAEMGQVAAGLAHEVNQPLTAIIYYLQAVRHLIAGNSADELQRAGEILEKTETQATRAAEIVKRLRAFIDRRAGEQRSENLATLIEEALALAMAGQAGREARVRLELAGGLPFVNVDRVQIQQVVVNLVQNALDAVRGSARQELSISAIAESGDFIRVAVSDTGAGIAPEVARTLFKEFVTTKDDGMGVGLSICKTIVESHGGKIWCNPNPGGGTIFQFTLPIAPQADA